MTPLQQFSRCECAQRENRIHRLGSLPPLDRPQHPSRSASIAPSLTAHTGLSVRLLDAANAARIAAIRCMRIVTGVRIHTVRTKLPLHPQPSRAAFDSNPTLGGELNRAVRLLRAGRSLAAKHFRKLDFNPKEKLRFTFQQSGAYVSGLRSRKMPHAARRLAISCKSNAAI